MHLEASENGPPAEDDIFGNTIKKKSRTLSVASNTESAYNRDILRRPYTEVACRYGWMWFCEW
jgi:uncharacterized protein YutD